MLHLVRKVFGMKSELDTQHVNRFEQMKNRANAVPATVSDEQGLMDKMRDSQVRPAAQPGRRMIGRGAGQEPDKSSEIARSIGFDPRKAQDANAIPAADIRTGFKKGF